MKLIIGLGNPGPEYTNTRHNVGFVAVDALAAKMDGAWKMDAKRKAETCKIQIGSEEVVLAKPVTFMNDSGEAVRLLASFYKVTAEDMLIVHDEMDLAPGRIQFKPAGGTAGHNGVASVVEALGTEDVCRLRIGVGRPTADDHQPAHDYVLDALSPGDAPNPLDIVAGMRDWIEGGIEKAMNRWNRS